MKKLGIFLVIVLTLILAAPNMSFADSERFDTFHSRSYYGHNDGDHRYYERHESHPYYYGERHEWHPYYYGYYGSPYPYYYVPSPYVLYGYGPSFGLNFGFTIR